MDRFFSLKCSLLRAKFRQNCCSGFRETAVTDRRTDKWTDERTNGGDSIGPFGFQPGTNNGDHTKERQLSIPTIGGFWIFDVIFVILAKNRQN